MWTVDEVVQECLMHIYDAEKAHEYYLRTRKLKGRQAAADVTTTVKPAAGIKTTVQKPGTPIKAQPIKKTAEQRRAEIAAQVEALRGKLAQLKEILAGLVAQAKARSGIEPEPTAEPAKTRTTGSSDRKVLTPQQQAEAAERAKQWREDNPDKVLDQEAVALDKKIKQVEEKIAEMREKLQTVLNNPFETTDSVGVGSNTPMRKDGTSQNGS